MTLPPRTPAASVAGCGVCALLAAVALGGWSPARPAYLTGSTHSHRSCTHVSTRGHGTHGRDRRMHRRDHRTQGHGHGTEGHVTVRHTSIRHCPKARHHGAVPHGQSHPAAPSPSTPAPSSGSSSTGPLGSTTPPTTGPPSQEGSTPPPALPEVQVSAVEFHFTLSRTTVPAGKVIIEFVNDGQDEHNLNAQGSSGPQAATFATEVPKAVTRQTLELHPGSYTLFCSLADHEAKGMKATLTVE